MVVLFAFTALAAEFAPDGDMEACYASFGRMLPADGSTGVSLDAGIALELSSASCGSGAYGLSLFKGESLDPVQEVVSTGSTGIVELVPASLLEPQTSYTILALESAGYMQSLESSFTTGNAVKPSTPWEVSVSAASAVWFEQEGRLDFSVSVEIPAERAETTWVRAGYAESALDTEPTIQQAFIGFGGDVVPFSWSTFPASMPTEACVAAQGRNENGTWTTGLVQCVVPTIEAGGPGKDQDDSTGCSVVTSSSAWLGLLSIALLRRRRA